MDETRELKIEAIDTDGHTIIYKVSNPLTGDTLHFIGGGPARIRQNIDIAAAFVKALVCPDPVGSEEREAIMISNLERNNRDWVCYDQWVTCRSKYNKKQYIKKQVSVLASVNQGSRRNLLLIKSWSKEQRRFVEIEKRNDKVWVRPLLKVPATPHADVSTSRKKL